MEYVRFRDGGTSATMANAEYPEFVELRRADSSPGEGWWPVRKVLPKPAPGAGQELAYAYSVSGGEAVKEYLLVPAGTRYARKSRIDGLRARDGTPVHIEIDEDLNPVVVEDET